MFLANIWTKDNVGRRGAVFPIQGRYNEDLFLRVLGPAARHSAFKLFVHGSNGKYRPFRQPHRAWIRIFLRRPPSFGFRESLVSEVDPERLRSLVSENTENRQFGFLGERRVNVLS
jgi:hypothetical protein